MGFGRTWSISAADCWGVEQKSKQTSLQQYEMLNDCTWSYTEELNGFCVQSGLFKARGIDV